MPLYSLVQLPVGRGWELWVLLLPPAPHLPHTISTFLLCFPGAPSQADRQRDSCATMLIKAQKERAQDH